MTNAIELQQVTKVYGDLEVLKGIDLTVHTGEIFTLLGPNGAGKSTLMKLLTTLSQPTGGTLRVLGLDPSKDGAAIRRRISLNAQTPTLDPEFTGFANLLLIARLRGVAQPKQAVKALGERLRLTEFLGRKVATYSGGMLRRLDLAMSLVGEADLYFFDEPTTGVDPTSQRELWAVIRELRDAGKTIFLTTQYLDEAEALADRIAFLEGGCIVRVDTPAGIRQASAPKYRLVTPDPARAAAALAGQAVTVDATMLTLPAESAQAALQTVVAAGVPVTDFSEVAVDLATVYFNLTDKRDK